MACGIVVRTIAPYLKSKTTDPAVIVMDEQGKHVISLLSGHIGGANVLAREIAGITGGTPVITTATDVNGVVSFDVFAVNNNCVFENITSLKHISSQLVNGGKVGLYTDCSFKNTTPENIVHIPVCDGGVQEKYECGVLLSNRTDINIEAEKLLVLRPRNLVLGIGCRRGTTREQIQSAFLDFMKNNNRSILSLRCIASIDLKKDEKGLLEFCSEYGMELKIIPRSYIQSIEENFTCSGFVKEKTGIASVAEPCAVLASYNGRLICRKTVYKGITLALSEEEKEYYI